MVIDGLTKKKIINVYMNLESLIREGDSPSANIEVKDDSEFGFMSELRKGLEGRELNYIKKVKEAFNYLISFSPATDSFKDNLTRNFYTMYSLNWFSTNWLLETIRKFLPLSSEKEFLFHLFEPNKIEEIEKKRYKMIKNFSDLGKFREKEKQHLIKWKIEIEEKYGSIE